MIQPITHNLSKLTTVVLSTIVMVACAGSGEGSAGHSVVTSTSTSQILSSIGVPSSSVADSSEPRVFSSSSRVTSESSSSALSRPILSPPYGGTVYLDPDIITVSDPTSFEKSLFIGRELKSVYDGRDQQMRDLEVYKYRLEFDDDIALEVHVMPAIGDQNAATEAVNRIARAVGQVPTQLRKNLKLIHIFAGDGRANAASWNNLITVYADANIGLERDGFLEELFIHEASHVSIDPDTYIDGRWLAAQDNDPTFISTYGRDNFRSEDVAESIMAYLAIRYKPGRISAEMDRTINASIPYRIAFLDKVFTGIYPIVDESASVKSRLEGSFISTPLPSDNVTFTWDAPDNATQFDLIVGTAGYGSADVRTSSVIANNQLLVSGLPSDGTPVFARLWSLVNNDWRYNDYRLAGYAPNLLTATLHSPVPGSRFVSEVVTFEWDRPNGATEFDLIVGTDGAGSDNLRASHRINDTHVQVNNIAAGSGDIYVRLLTNKGDWRYEDFVYQADFGNAELVSPLPGARLISETVNFQWRASRSASNFDILVGTNGPGSTNIRATQVLQGNNITISGLPTDGSPIYVRLWTYKKDWQYVDYHFN